MTLTLPLPVAVTSYGPPRRACLWPWSPVPADDPPGSWCALITLDSEAATDEFGPAEINRKNIMRLYMSIAWHSHQEFLGQLSCVPSAIFLKHLLTAFSTKSFGARIGRKLYQGTVFEVKTFIRETSCQPNYRQVSNIRHISRQWNCRSLRCSWSIACRRCSNYIFILDLTPGFIELGKDNCKTRRKTFKFGDLVHLI